MCVCQGENKAAKAFTNQRSDLEVRRKTVFDSSRRKKKTQGVVEMGGGHICELLRADERAPACLFSSESRRSSKNISSSNNNRVQLFK